MPVFYWLCQDQHIQGGGRCTGCYFICSRQEKELGVCSSSRSIDGHISDWLQWLTMNHFHYLIHVMSHYCEKCLVQASSQIKCGKWAAPFISVCRKCRIFQNHTLFPFLKGTVEEIITHTHTQHKCKTKVRLVLISEMQLGNYALDHH